MINIYCDNKKMANNIKDMMLLGQLCPLDEIGVDCDMYIPCYACLNCHINLFYYKSSEDGQVLEHIFFNKQEENSMFDSENEKVEMGYSVKVERATKLKDKDVVMFDITVNGVTIRGMSLYEYKNKEGKKNMGINYPSYKGSNDQWYTHAFFPINAGTKDVIVNQIKKMIK